MDNERMSLFLTTLSGSANSNIGSKASTAGNVSFACFIHFSASYSGRRRAEVIVTFLSEKRSPTSRRNTQFSESAASLPLSKLSTTYDAIVCVLDLWIRHSLDRAPTFRRPRL